MLGTPHQDPRPLTGAGPASANKLFLSPTPMTLRQPITTSLCHVQNCKRKQKMSNNATALGPRSPISDIEVDAAIEAELRENDFRSTRRTKLICTIGPACCSPEMLDGLASRGMNVARLNMSHADHDWHRSIIRRIRELNAEKGYSIAIMMDTEGGSEVHLASLDSPRSVKAGEMVTLTIRDFGASLMPPPDLTFAVNFAGFVEDVVAGDVVSIDGGMVSLEVERTSGPDIICTVVDPGLVLPRASITLRRNNTLVRAKNALLPVISSKDWNDIDMAIEEKVDYISVSFVKNSTELHNLRSYIASKTDVDISIIAKIESYDSIPRLGGIIEASDAVMVARGDLGAQVLPEEVPSLQREIVMRCRQLGVPVIVASQLLESMHTLPTPTRAEVADIADAVRQRADALMLSGESAVGQYPDRALDVLRTVATRAEEWCRTVANAPALEAQWTSPEVHGGASNNSSSTIKSAGLPGNRISEHLCSAACMVANGVGARAIFCFTKRGYMAGYLSRLRPSAPIFAFCDDQRIRLRLAMRWGVIPFRLDFSDDPETNVLRTFELLKRRELVNPGDVVVVVSDIIAKQDGPFGRADAGTVSSVQVRNVP